MESKAHLTVSAWVTDWMVKEFGLQAGELGVDVPFLSFGMNSIQAMMLVGDLEARFRLRLKPTLVWDYPTIAAVTNYLVKTMSVEQTNLGEPRQDTGVMSSSAPTPFTSAASPEELLAKLNDLSEEEIDALLAKYQHQQT